MGSVNTSPSHIVGALTNTSNQRKSRSALNVNLNEAMSIGINANTTVFLWVRNLKVSIKRARRILLKDLSITILILTGLLMYYFLTLIIYFKGNDSIIIILGLSFFIIMLIINSIITTLEIYSYYYFSNAIKGMHYSEFQLTSEQLVSIIEEVLPRLKIQYDRMSMMGLLPGDGLPVFARRVAEIFILKNDRSRLLVENEITDEVGVHVALHMGPFKDENRFNLDLIRSSIDDQYVSMVPEVVTN
jgi:hypothetical protein